MEIRRRPPNPKVRVAHLEYAVPHEDDAPRHILEEIVWEKDRETDAARERVPLVQLKRQVADLPAGFHCCAQSQLPQAAVIAGSRRPVKQGVIADFDPEAIARGYQAGGASASPF